jgi:hypothetical protein
MRYASNRHAGDLGNIEAPLVGPAEIYIVGMINQKIVFLLFYFFLKDVSCFMLMNEKKS